MLYDIVIIGGGPAGLSAGIYAARAGLKAVILEQEPFTGGQINNTLEINNYLGLPRRSGVELAQLFEQHVDGACAGENHAEIRKQCSVAGLAVKDGRHKIVTLGNGETLTGKAVVIATGASPAKLGIPGEENFTGHGVSYCAACDGAFFTKKTVAVIGGGDTAAEDALYLSRICREVFLVHRRDSLRAAKPLQAAVQEKGNIRIKWNTKAEAIYPGHNGQLELNLCDTENETAKSMIVVDGIFVAIGTNPNSRIFRGMLACDTGGHILTDNACRTAVLGIYAAGDVRASGIKQVITAVSDGAVAVQSAVQWLNTIDT